MERDFKGIWIPKEIWLDERLGVLDKIILMEIDSLDCDDDGCYASNKYLADFCQCTEIKISNSISKLIKLGYLEVIKFDGRKRYLKSSLKKSLRQTQKNFKADLKKIKENNINNNIHNNNNIYSEVIDYLNEKTNQHYKPSTNKTIALIKARLNEKFNLEDFKKVIDNKAQEWLGTDMEKYLRPETLFGTKFEGYLNQKNSNLPKWFGKDIKEEVEEDEYDKLAEQYTRGYLEP